MIGARGPLLSYLDKLHQENLGPVAINMPIFHNAYTRDQHITEPSLFKNNQCLLIRLHKFTHTTKHCLKRTLMYTQLHVIH